MNRQEGREKCSPQLLKPERPFRPRLALPLSMYDYGHVISAVSLLIYKIEGQDKVVPLGPLRNGRPMRLGQFGPTLGCL